MDNICPQHCDWEAFRNHVTIEEHLHAENNARMAEGNQRMANIEKELKPLQKLYNMVMGASALVGVLIALLIYIYSVDKAQVVQLHEAVHKQGVVLEKLIVSHQELEKDTAKELARIEKTLDKWGK